jgi:hypothetical protein
MNHKLRRMFQAALRGGHWIQCGHTLGYSDHHRCAVRVSYEVLIEADGNPSILETSGIPRSEWTAILQWNDEDKKKTHLRPNSRRAEADFHRSFHMLLAFDLAEIKVLFG